MSVIGYCFSIEGASHKEKQIPCQDSSGILKKGAWRLAIVADGVGSCKYSDAASKLAVETASKVVNAAFPYEGDENFLSLIRIAMHSAENAIETYVVKSNGSLSDYQTTLAMALYNGTTLYYGNAGDSGVVALDEFGSYHVLSSKQNNEYGDVHTLAERKFEVGKAEFKAAAVFCMTDGLLDWVVPDSLSKHRSPIHIPRANLFVSPNLWAGNAPVEEAKLLDYGKKLEGELANIVKLFITGTTEVEEYGKLNEGNLRDDLSAAVLINNESLIDPNSIVWVAPAEPSTDEKYLTEWKNIKIMYPTVAKKKFIEFISSCNPKWNEDSVFEYAEKIWHMESEPKEQNGDSNLVVKKAQKKKAKMPEDNEWITPDETKPQCTDQSEDAKNCSSKRGKGIRGKIADFLGISQNDEEPISKDTGEET